MSGPSWLTVEDVIGMHDLHLSEFGGFEGIRDRNGVESATMRAQQHWNYTNEPDVFFLAAIYVESFATTQHFIDGNKRTGFHCALLFLRLNGYRLVSDPFLAAQAVLDVANKIMSVEQMAEWFRLHSEKS